MQKLEQESNYYISFFPPKFLYNYGNFIRKVFRKNEFVPNQEPMLELRMKRLGKEVTLQLQFYWSQAFVKLQFQKFEYQHLSLIMNKLIILIKTLIL